MLLAAIVLLALTSTILLLSDEIYAHTQCAHTQWAVGTPRRFRVLLYEVINSRGDDDLVFRPALSFTYSTDTAVQ